MGHQGQVVRIQTYYTVIADRGRTRQPPAYYAVIANLPLPACTWGWPGPVQTHRHRDARAPAVARDRGTRDPGTRDPGIE